MPSPMNKGTVATILFMLSCCWLASPALSQGVRAALDIPLIERPPELEDFLREAQRPMDDQESA